MEKGRKNILLKAIGLALAIGVLSFAREVEAIKEYAMLVASVDGKGTQKACSLLNKYLLDDKGEIEGGIISGLSYIDGKTVKPHKLTIYDIGDGNEIEEEMREANVVVLAYGGAENKEENEKFKKMPQLHKRVMSPMAQEPVVVMLRLDELGRQVSVPYWDMVNMGKRLNAYQKDIFNLERVKRGLRAEWVFYPRVRDDSSEDEFRGHGCCCGGLVTSSDEEV